MKTNLLLRIIAGVTVSTCMFNIPSLADTSNHKYSCIEVDSIHGIYSSRNRGKINMINFVRDVSEKWTMENRCNTVAERFQRFHDSDVLRYIGADYVNNQPVLCAVVEKGDLCNPGNVLVTLPPKTDPVTGARKLMDTRGLAIGRVISVNGKKGKLENYVDGNTYYDLRILEELILEDENSDRLIPHE